VTAREDDDDIAETQRHRPAFDPQARAPWIAFLDHDDVWRGYLGSFVG
jgi:hypothetical protein